MATPTPYAVQADLTNYGVASVANFGPLTSGQLQAALDAANALADSYLAAQHTLPLTAWGKDLTEAVIAVARFKLLTSRGFNPEGDHAAAIVEAKKDAIRWFEGVANGSINPVVTDSGGTRDFVEAGSADPQNAGQFVINRQPVGRGW
jgi:phage gp36-like protein